MAKLSAKGVKSIYECRTEVDVFFKVGNCKLDEGDLAELISLRNTCRENPIEIVDRRENPDLKLYKEKSCRNLNQQT